MTVFQIIYTQTIVGNADNHLAETRPEVYFQIGYPAIEDGWLRQFQRRWADLGVLIALGLHARPLLGDDLDLMIRLGLATASDRGRLYARITDLGLSEVTGIDRKDGIPVCTERLSQAHLMRRLSLPADFRDSRGRFDGQAAYLLLGSVVSQSDYRGGLPPMVGNHRGGLSPTVTGKTGLHRGGLPPIKNITMSSTLSQGESGANRAPADLDVSGETGLVLDGANEADEPTSAASGNGSDVNHAGAATGPAADPQAYRLLRAIWGRLDRAVGDVKSLNAFRGLLEDLEGKLGFTEAGFRAARLGFEPLPDRRRRVLDDLRRMLGRSDLSPSQRKRNLIGILTQNIGVTLGLGLLPDGHLRALADKPDYTVIGGLIDESGAEVVWLAACEIAGRAFEGDPIAYLRATLRNKRERERSAGQSGAGSTPRVGAGMGRFEQLNYLDEQVGVEDVA